MCFSHFCRMRNGKLLIVCSDYGLSIAKESSVNQNIILVTLTYWRFFIRTMNESVLIVEDSLFGSAQQLGFAVQTQQKPIILSARKSIKAGYLISHAIK